MTRWVPKDMEWFLADLIQQFTFMDGSHSIYVNTILVKANSVEEAYEKALGFGEVYNHSFTNTDQEEVKVSFRGLRDLYLIYEEYEEITEEQIAAMVTPKEKLRVFEMHGPEKSERSTPNHNEALQ